MRILFTFAGGSGHFQPLVPIARAAESAGHTIKFAGQPAMVAAIETAGFAAIPTEGSTLSTTGERMPLLKVDIEREESDLREGFVRRLARQRISALSSVIADWQPDLIVCDEVDFGAMIAAEKLGLPYAVVSVIAAGNLVRPDVVADALNEVRAEHDLPPDPDLAMLSRHLLITPFPPSYRDPAYPLPPTAHTIRPTMPTHTGESIAWTPPLDGAPIVYFTLGTVFNVESGDLFERVLAGLRNLPVNVIATTGRELDPAIFWPQPPHVQIERYIPQAMILPHADLVISHGGSGSVIGGLAHGVPMVLIPMGADQPHNALRCEALGVARQLDALEATPQSVREAVMGVLSDERCRQAAERLRDEIAALPDPATVIPLLEGLVQKSHHP